MRHGNALFPSVLIFLFCSQNQIYVFKKHSGDKYSHIAEIRSAKEGVVGYRPISQLYVKYVNTHGGGAQSGAAAKYKPGCLSASPSRTHHSRLFHHAFVVSEIITFC